MKNPNKEIFLKLSRQQLHALSEQLQGNETPEGEAIAYSIVVTSIASNKHKRFDLIK